MTRPRVGRLDAHALTLAGIGCLLIAAGRVLKP